MGGKEETKKTQTKQKYFGKCLLNSDAEAWVFLRKCRSAGLPIPGSATGSFVLTVSCCRGFAWSEPSKESFDEAAAVRCPSSERTSAAESPVKVVVEFRPSHALSLAQVWFTTFFLSWIWFGRVSRQQGWDCICSFSGKLSIFPLIRTFSVILSVLSGVT